ncbi:MAG: hypothetical protein IJF39_01530 [Clostridia bacterium]|nr:hypothetical protein [Clostridia bacterium]
MAQQKKGLIARMLEGKERSEDYARSTLPTNRWQLFFDIFKGNFGKLVKINLLTLLFFIPLLAVVIFSVMYTEAMGALYPFGANLGVGYPVAPNMQGQSEMLALTTDTTAYLLLTLSSIIAAVGLAGGMYVVRNMVWTEGIFVANDFWRGVKLNFKNALQAALFFVIVLSLTVLMQDMVALTRVQQNLSSFQDVMLTISSILSYIFLGVATCMSFWMIALGVNYKMGFITLFKNAFLMTIGMLPQTLFFGFLALLPYLLFLIAGQGFFLMIAIMILLLFALSYTLLVWLDFAQWAFDKYINPKISGAKVGRGIYDKNALSEEGENSEATLEYHRVILAAGKSQLVARPIKPIDDELRVYDLPPSYSRDDLKKLRESKEAIVADSEAYVEEHKDDERYVEYNRQFDEREKALQEAEQGKKHRKRKTPKILEDKKK